MGYTDGIIALLRKNRAKNLHKTNDGSNFAPQMSESPAFREERLAFGEMAEWSNAAVLKTVEANYLQGFESLSLRFFLPDLRQEHDGSVAQLDRATAF